jgi:adenylosuccinate lyase
MAADRLLSPSFVPDEMADVLGDRAWLQALLDVEAALAIASAAAGTIPGEAAEAIAAAADRAADFDIDGLEGARDGVAALVDALARQVGPEYARFVHHGAADRDVRDTAAMLVARPALDLIRTDLDTIGDACALLARRAPHWQLRISAAGWLITLGDAWTGLTTVATTRLAVQLGGADGVLRAFGDRGGQVLARFAEELDMPEPVVPWQSSRGRWADLGAALAVAAGTLANVAVEADATPDAGDGHASEAVCAAALRVQGAAGVLTAALPGDGADSAWHVQAGALREALALTGGAAAATRTLVQAMPSGDGAAPDDPVPGTAAAFVERALAAYAEQR